MGYGPSLIFTQYIFLSYQDYNQIKRITIKYYALKFGDTSFEDKVMLDYIIWVHHCLRL